MALKILLANGWSPSSEVGSFTSAILDRRECKLSLDHYGASSVIDKIPNDLSDMVVLDIGAGWGMWGFLLKMYTDNPPKHLIACELNPVHIKRLERMNIYDEVIMGDVVKILPSLSHRRIDLVVMSHVVEHMTKHDVINVLGLLKEKFQSKIIIKCPAGDSLSDPSRDLMIGQPHISKWFKKDFIAEGFEVEHIPYSKRAGRAVSLFERFWFWVKGMDKGGVIVAWWSPQVSEGARGERGLSKTL